MRVVSHARTLGIDAYGAGATRQRRKQYERLTKIKKRMPKVKFYKKYGVITSKSAKAGLAPSGLHGVRCMGVPLTRLKALGTTIGRCLPGKHAGRSVNWWLAGHQCDPIHPCRVEPIAAWAEPVWDEQLDDADLRKAWRRQQRLVGLKTRRGARSVVRLVPASWTSDSWDGLAAPHDLRHCEWTRDGCTRVLSATVLDASCLTMSAGWTSWMGSSASPRDHS